MSLEKEFASRFFGYGNLDAPLWFIGKEEGGWETAREMQQRLRAWKNMGQKEVVCSLQFHRKAGIHKYHSAKKIEEIERQKTWCCLIRIILFAKGELCTKHAILDYQSKKLGEKTGESCLLDLRLPKLLEQKLKGDLTKIVEGRARWIREQIKLRRPRAVVFYSMHKKFMKYWSEISGVSTDDFTVKSPQYRIARKNGTSFIMMQHPAQGVSHELLYEIGRLIKGKLNWKEGPRLRP